MSEKRRDNRPVTWWERMKFLAKYEIKKNYSPDGNYHIDVKNRLNSYHFCSGLMHVNTPAEIEREVIDKLIRQLRYQDFAERTNN